MATEDYLCFVTNPTTLTYIFPVFSFFYLINKGLPSYPSLSLIEDAPKIIP